jgi:hypothetical protein|tara:strand:+ start:1763 stop:2152 length:390 start_codon:yes stop_codon:yes gene_type:complete
MATYTGKNGAVYVGANAVAEIKDWSLETTSETVTDTVMGDSWVTHKPTLKSWTSSFNAIWDDADTNGQLALVEGAEVTINLYPTGNNSGDVEWTGAVIVTSVSKTASFDGLVEASFSVTGNGPLTTGTV